MKRFRKYYIIDLTRLHAINLDTINFTCLVEASSSSEPRRVDFPLIFWIRINYIF